MPRTGKWGGESNEPEYSEIRVKEKEKGQCP